jgi:hypothetical protein
LTAKTTEHSDSSPDQAWNDYAFRSGLLNKDGIAPDPHKTQTAYNAYRAAWNAAIRAATE